MDACIIPSPVSVQIYQAAKDNLGKHVTLDPSVPIDVGCAEAVSYILKAAGVLLPARGFASTADLCTWAHSCGYFTEVPVGQEEPGDLVVSPSGAPTALLPHGHAGIVARFGICSNNSYTGLFSENYTMDSWLDYFKARAHFPVYLFRCNLQRSNS